MPKIGQETMKPTLMRKTTYLLIPEWVRNQCGITGDEECMLTIHRTDSRTTLTYEFETSDAEATDK